MTEHKSPKPRPDILVISVIIIALLPLLLVLAALGYLLIHTYSAENDGVRETVASLFTPTPGDVRLNFSAVEGSNIVRIAG